jgi:hypothetical protein
MAKVNKSTVWSRPARFARSDVDIGKVLAELRRERKQLEEVIECFERVALLGTRRQGRPPKWLLQIKAKQGVGRPATRKSRARVTADPHSVAAIS